jgi:DNA processing protein
MIQLTPGDTRYPKRLRAVSHPPDPLWVWGTLPDHSIPTVGIVGTRRLTPYGARVARQLAITLARAGAVVVSGLAQGIDSTAHAGAIDAAGRTIAVLGEGLAWFDDHGPLRRRQLAHRIRVQGALVSEYPLDVHAKDWTFPRRNATIAGLSDALVVVEAPDGSGALITARRMLELKRPVFAVAGPFGAPTWIGSHQFIRDRRAQLLSNVQQVTDVLGLRLMPMADPNDEALERRLMDALETEPADADAIAVALRISPGRAAQVIAQRLIAGAIVPTGDGRFARVR